MALKIGQKIRFRKDLVVGTFYGDIELLAQMECVIGKTYEIMGFHPDEPNAFRIEDCGFWYSVDMVDSSEGEKL